MNMFFESERFNISQIVSIAYYEPSCDKKDVYPGCLPTYELMFYTKGDTYLTFNGKRIHMRVSDILYLPKGIVNADYYVDITEKFALYNVYFDTDEEMPQVPIHISSVPNEVGNVYEKLYNEWLAKKDGYYFKSVQDFYRILEMIKKHRRKYNTKAKFKCLAEAEDYISCHYYKTDFKYEKLHELSGVSYSYFNKLFNDKYGMPPVKFVTHLKIKRACELLKSGTFTATQVSEMCGFENVYYFSNVFTKNMGISPGKFKKLSAAQSNAQ
jgi:AraC-like DNA-binding protein